MIEKLKGIIPDNVILELPSVIEKFNIDSILKMSHFISQCSHESGNFKLIRENLNYSADELLKTFPKYFTKDNVNEYARQPQKIANIVYANRMGNILPNSGYKYSGKGYIQITGYDNYKLFDSFVEDDIINNPDLVATKYPLMSAAWYFKNKKIWDICENSDMNTITKITKMINGGIIGLNDRILLFNKIYNILNG